MTERQTDRDRERRVRRTASAQRGLIAVGTVGALGAAVAIGVSQAARSTNTGSGQQDGVSPPNAQPQQSGEPDDHEGHEGSSDDEDQQPHVQHQQPQQGGGQLAVPGNGGPAQAQSGGS